MRPQDLRADRRRWSISGQSEHRSDQVSGSQSPALEKFLLKQFQKNLPIARCMTPVKLSNHICDGRLHRWTGKRARYMGAASGQIDRIGYPVKQRIHDLALPFRCHSGSLLFQRLSMLAALRSGGGPTGPDFVAGGIVAGNGSPPSSAKRGGGIPASCEPTLSCKMSPGNLRERTGVRWFVLPSTPQAALRREGCPPD